MSNAAQRGLREISQSEVYGTLLPFSAGNSGATFAPDCANAETQTVTLTAACTIGAPLNPPAIGSKLSLVFVQDTTGGRAVTWNAAYRNAPAVGGGSATAGQRALAEFKWDGASWQCTGGASAFA